MARRVLLGFSVTALAALMMVPAHGDDPSTDFRIDVGPLGTPLATPFVEVRPVVLADLPVGVALPATPAVLPLTPRAPTLHDIRSHMQDGDTRRALAAAEAFVEAHPYGRDRDAAWFLIGMLEAEDGHHNAASEAFTKVRTADGPLAPLAAWHEAEQDLARGKGLTAVRECEVYRETWPDGAHFDDCLRIIAQGYASEGRAWEAQDAAAKYDADHTDTPIAEQIELRLATWEARNAPEKATRRLKTLVTTYRSPLTGRVAEELLVQLAEQGVADAVVPDDTASLKSRAYSLRSSGRKAEAWAVFETLRARAVDDPALAAWVESEGPSMAENTRHWDDVVDKNVAQYEAAPSGDAAWEVYRVLVRAGRWEEASDWAVLGQTQYGGTRNWVYSQEQVGRSMMLAGRYTEARSQFDTVASRGGWTGRRGAYLAGFCALLGGDAADAVTRFDAILASNRDHLPESRYWRAKALDRVGRADDAARDRQWILEHEKGSWYAVLVRQGDPDLPVDRPFARDGAWPGAALPEPPPSPIAHVTGRVPVASPVAAAPQVGTAAFGTLTWPMRVGPAASRAPAEVLRADLTAPPPSYPPGNFFDPVSAEEATIDFATAWGETWPELPAIVDLASVGLYDIAGPMFSKFYESWDEAYRYRSDPRHAVARTIASTQEVWRPLFLFTRDHHHAARFSYGLGAESPDPAVRRQGLMMSHPLAHDRFVWRHARANDVDPYLVLGLMRQESTYNPNALSKAGARGAMQIMPRTGHLVADIHHDTTFTAADLEDPILSIGFGLTYLGLLMERFDGVYPLAVASYNGGPFNVSTWLLGTGMDMPMDEFVEHIPFRETQGYVMKVTEGYATYLAAYAPEGTHVVVPDRARGDDASIVDF